jgi:uncharacterized protein
MLRRYASIDRRDAIELAFETLFVAKDLIHAHPRISARDALHAAVMRRHEIIEVLSFDRGFDAIAQLTRLPAPP